MTEKEWLTSLKVDDKVIITHSPPGGKDISRVGRVIRRTKTLILVKLGETEYKFRASDGRQPGGTIWDRRYSIEEYTEAKRNAILLSIKREQFKKMLSKLDVNKLSADDLTELTERLQVYFED